MKVDFTQSKFVTDYSFSSPRAIIRILSDAFSKQHCRTDEAIRYAAQATNGRCLYCGMPLYKNINGQPVFTNLIHYDHIYPASRFNLFEVGNIALACETCNLAKSNKLPMDYYDMRTAENVSLLIYDRNEFEQFLNSFTKPYREKWPKHFEAGLMELTDEEFKEKLTELLYNNINIAPMVNRYDYENSVNCEIWNAIIEKANKDYAPMTAKDALGRIGYTNELFQNMFGYDKLISECTLDELADFVDKLLLSKYESKNEISKYRMLIKLLTQVLNEQFMEGQLEDFYKNVPTYSSLSKL